MEHTKMPPYKEAGLRSELQIPQTEGGWQRTGYTVQPKLSNIKIQTHTYCKKRSLRPRGSLLPCEPKCQCNRSVLPTAPAPKYLHQQKLQD